MDVINSIMNLVAPPFLVLSLCIFLLPYLLIKCILRFYYSIFSENVAGKVVLITGASSGIGEHLALEYAKRGACLAVVARRKKKLRGVVNKARKIGSPDVLMILADVQKVDDCKRIVHETVNHFGRLDHLVNNAGCASVCLLEETIDVTDFRTVMDTNFWGSVYPTRFAIPYLRQSRGKIVVISSIASWMPEPRMSFYCASKAAVLSFFETLRIELRPDVHVLIVTPGYTESELTQGKFLLKDGKFRLHQDLRDAQVGVIPVLRVAECARSIVNSTCRGDKYLTEPIWASTTWLWKALVPDAIEWLLCGFGTKPDQPPTEAYSKILLDLTGAKNILYPESIRKSELKIE